MAFLSHRITFMNTMEKKKIFWLNITHVLTNGFLCKRFYRTYNELSSLAFTCMDANKVLLQNSEWHCVNVAMYLLLLIALPLLSVHDLVLDLLKALWECCFPFYPKSKHICLIFM